MDLMQKLEHVATFGTRTTATTLQGKQLERVKQFIYAPFKTSSGATGEANYITIAAMVWKLVSRMQLIK